MLRLNNLIFLLIFSTYCYSQSDIIDDKYREDQIYIGIYYNSLKNTPGFYSQTQFSSSINLGFIRDIPLNKNRNFGIGIGMGLSTSSYHNNLRFSLIDNQFAADVILDSEPFDKNKWTLNELEFPFEIRWRTSTPENYKFWRVYFGVKTSYLLKSKYKFESIHIRSAIRTKLVPNVTKMAPISTQSTIQITPVLQGHVPSAASPGAKLVPWFQLTFRVRCSDLFYVLSALSFRCSCW